MRFRRPELIPLLFIICATLTLGGLGVWQLERLHWKQGIINEIDAAQQAAPLTALPPDISGLRYHNVALHGTFLNEKTFHLAGGIQGEGPGFFILTPFQLDDGRIVIVNRGFAPRGKENAVTGPQTVHGVLRPLRDKRFFSPENEPGKNLWFYEDLPAMSRIISAPILPLVVEVLGPRPTEHYPVPNENAKMSDTLRNDHFGYAITWFSVMLIGLVMFAFYHRIEEPKA